MAYKIGSAIIGVCVLALAGWAYTSRERLQSPEPLRLKPSAVEWVEVEPDFSPDWLASFSASSQGVQDPSRSRAGDSTYRLAGTFISYDTARAEDHQRKAIIDNISENRQSLVSLGEDMDSLWVVTAIESERVELESKTGRVLTLYLGLTPSTNTEPSRANVDLHPRRLEDMPAISTSAFGKQISEDRWVLSRQSIVDYYHEILDQPDRLANIFLSMEDVVEGDQRVGYRVGPKGEQPFFDAFGLQSNDVVKAVNSMNMVSPRRSQYLFQEFMQNRVNTFVFDVDRNGEEKKLIYLIR